MTAIPLTETTVNLPLAADLDIRYPWWPIPEGGPPPTEVEQDNGAHVVIVGSIVVAVPDLLAGVPAEVRSVETITARIADFDDSGDDRVVRSLLTVSVPVARALWATLGRALSSVDALQAVAVPASTPTTESEPTP